MASDKPEAAPSGQPPKLTATPPILHPESPTNASSPTLEGRLHPVTLLFTVWRAFRGMILPILIISITTEEFLWVMFLIILTSVSVLWGMARYFFFTYRLTEDELVTRGGIFAKTQRNIPLSRIQDVHLKQGPLHRLFKVVDVRVETAGGGGVEAELSVVPIGAGEELRRVLFERTQGLKADRSSTDEATPKPATLWETPLKDLVLAGLTSKRVASLLVIVFFVLNFVDDLSSKERVNQFFEAAVSWLKSGETVNWLILTAVVVLLIVLSLSISVGGFILLFHRFRLTRVGEDLHRRHGLFTHHSSTLPRRRIQLLKVDESWLRRWLKLAALRVDTAGFGGANSGQTGGRGVLVPVIPSAAVERLLPDIFPELDSAPPDWRRVSKRAILRGFIKASLLVCLLTAAVLLARQDLWGLWPLALLPLILWLNVKAYRHLGYALQDKIFQTRQGWLSRATHIVPVRNVQVVALLQNPFDRRHGVMTLQVDTAGQTFTGGGPQIRNLPVASAQELASVLAHRAAKTRFQSK